MSNLVQLTTSTCGLFKSLQVQFNKPLFVISANDKYHLLKAPANFGKKSVIAIAFVILAIVSPLLFITELGLRTSLFKAEKKEDDKRFTTLFFVRHGETNWNTEGRAQGSIDIPLNVKGKDQAKTLANALVERHPTLSAIYSSPLSRAYDTAINAADALNLSVKKEPAFTEICHGVAEGMKLSEKRQKYADAEKELDAKYPERVHRWKYTAIPAAETYFQVANRVMKALGEIVKAHPGEKIAIFTHSRVIKIMIDLFSTESNQAHHVDNCCIAQFDFVGNDGEPGKPFKFVNLSQVT